MLTSQIKDANGHGKTTQISLRNMCRDNTRSRTTHPRANRFDEKEDIENTKETWSAPRLDQMPIGHYSLHVHYRCSCWLFQAPMKRKIIIR